MAVRIYLNTDDGEYPVDICLDASVNRLKETIRVTSFGKLKYQAFYYIPTYLQCIYFNERNIGNENKSLQELGIQKGSLLDFCIDTEMVELCCKINNKKIEFRHSERCLVSLFCQDCLFVVYDLFHEMQSLAKSGIRINEKQSILLSYQGIHLQDRYQACFYPLFHYTQHAEVELEIVDYIGVKNGILVQRCCKHCRSG